MCPHPATYTKLASSTWRDSIQSYHYQLPLYQLLKTLISQQTQTVPVGNLRAGSDITPSTTQFDCDSPGFFQEIHEREQTANLGLLLTISSSLTLWQSFSVADEDSSFQAVVHSNPWQTMAVNLANACLIPSSEGVVWRWQLFGWRSSEQPWMNWLTDLKDLNDLTNGIW